jgi:hypothetical protein
VQEPCEPTSTLPWHLLVERSLPDNDSDLGCIGERCKQHRRLAGGPCMPRMRHEHLMPFLLGWCSYGLTYPVHLAKEEKA